MNPVIATASILGFLFTTHAASAQTANARDTLRGHSIVVRVSSVHTCRKEVDRPKRTCQSTNMSAVWEIRAKDNLVFSTSKGTGVVYDLDQPTTNLLVHPLMKGYWGEQSRQIKEHQSAARIADTRLTLEDRYQYGRTGDLGAHETASTTQIEISATGCRAQFTSITKLKSETSESDFKATCEIVPLQQAKATSPLERDIVFRRLVDGNGSRNVMDFDFEFINGVHYRTLWACDANNTLGVTFQLKSASTKNTVNCSGSYGQYSVSFETDTQTDGNKYTIRSKGKYNWRHPDNSKGGGDYELQIAIRIDGQECKLERYYLKRDGMIEKSDDSSLCFLRER